MGKLKVAALVVAVAVVLGVVYPDSANALIFQAMFKGRQLYQQIVPQPNPKNISSEALAFEWILRLNPISPDIDLKTMRKNCEGLGALLPLTADVQVEDLTVPHTKYTVSDVGAKPWATTINMQQTILVKKLTPASKKNDKVVVYFHGGGFAAGSTKAWTGLGAELAARLGSTVYLVDYGLCPEYTFGTQVFDALEVYDWLLTKLNMPAKNIYFGGDSAGGALAIYTLQAIRDRKLPQPRGAFCISPWTDLSNSLPSYKGNKDVDAMIVSEEDDRPFRGVPQFLFTPTTQRSQVKSVSPLHQNLEGLAPMFIQVGGYDELLLDDSVEFSKKAKEAGVDVTLKVYPGMQHIFTAFYALVPEARAALDDLTAWVTSH